MRSFAAIVQSGSSGDAEIAQIRSSIARRRLGLISKRAFVVAVGLQDLELPAFLTMLIVQEACASIMFRCINNGHW